MIEKAEPQTRYNLSPTYLQVAQKNKMTESGDNMALVTKSQEGKTKKKAKFKSPGRS